MRIGYIGLGKMGINMVSRLVEKGHEIFAYDINEMSRKEAEACGARSEVSLKELVSLLPPPRLLWFMVPHATVDAVIAEVVQFLEAGDTVIDGGNSFYRDSARRYGEFQAKSISFLDAGVSGGPSGARNGACVMVGGEQAVFERYNELFRDVAVHGGYMRVGETGAGHFVKMVHNGIEYGMMQALAEGFNVLRASEYKLDLEKVADLYNHRSVIESRLVEWLKNAYEKFGPDLNGISGSAGHTGEGQWTVEVARALGIPVPIIEGALKYRVASESMPSYTGQVLSALRNQFGGHDAHNGRIS